MTAAAAPELTPLDVYRALMAARRGDPVEAVLAKILASWSVGNGALPQWLGLRRERFEQMMRRHFPGYSPDALPNLCATVEVERHAEIEDLLILLMQNRTDGTESEALVAEIVAAACMGGNHLWQDLGLWCRDDLSRLIAQNFAPLAVRNVADMKWKKFLYKQLCEAEGIYTCRAPSCEVCVDYAACFGPED